MDEEQEKRNPGRGNSLSKVPEAERSLSVKEERECVAGRVYHRGKAGRDKAG